MVNSLEKRENLFEANRFLGKTRVGRACLRKLENVRRLVSVRHKFSKAFRRMTSRPFEASCQLVSESWGGEGRLNRRPGIDSFATRVELADDNGGGDEHKYREAKFGKRVERTG